MHGRAHPLIVAAAMLAVATVAGADTKVDQRVECDANGMVSISNVAGEVEVVAWDRNEVHVTGTIDDKVEELHVDAEDGDVDIEVELPRRMKGRGGEARLVVQVPKGVALSVETVSADVRVQGAEGELELESVSGTIELRSDAAQAELGTVSGTIDVEGRVKSVEAASVSGSIRLRETSGRAEAETTSGSITIEGGDFENVSCTSVSGSIRFDGNPTGSGEFDFENFSGTVTLILPKDVSASFEVETFSGDIHSDLGGRVHKEEFGPGASMDVAYGDGDAEFSVSTFSGKVLIKAE